jgi:VanZ family protein
MKKFLQNNRWSILWGLFLVILHLIPGYYFPRLPRFTDLFQPDKLVHIAMFGVFSFLLLRGFRRQDNPEFVIRHAAILMLIIALPLGAMLELTQAYLIPNRTGSPFDFIANAVGVGLGWWVSCRKK